MLGSLRYSWQRRVNISLLVQFNCSLPYPCTRAQIKDLEEVTNKMYGRNIDIEVTPSGSLICARV